METPEIGSTRFWEEAAPRVLAPPRLQRDGSRLEALLRPCAWAEGLVVFASSGSAGPPKWVALQREALCSSARAVNGHMAAGADDRWLLSLPVFHVGGFGVAARAREAGGELIGMTGRWEPRAFVDLAGESRSTLASLVPTQLHDIVREGLAAPPDLRAVLVGGGRLPAGQARQARGLGWPVVRTYGMTETGSQIATAPIQDRDPDPDAPLQVLGIWDVDLTEDRLLKLRGPALLDSYLHEEGGKVVRNDPKEHGWFTTSDVVRCDHRGLSLLGRADRRVKVLGELVDVSHLEGQLADRWAGECCVAVVPDERRGARLVPVFDGEPVETSRRIVQSLNGELPGFARLEEPCHLHPWPRTAVGKTCYRSVTGKIGAGPSS